MPMTSEFGLDLANVIDSKSVEDEIREKIDANFDLILVHEMWDKSMVLLKKLLNFDHSDMVNLRSVNK